MNETETHVPAQGPEIEWQVAALQRQIFLLLLALIVITATMVFYLYYQSRILANDLDTYRPGALQIIQTYNANARIIANFESQVSNYGATHPAFISALKQNGLLPANTPVTIPSNMPATTPPK